MARQVGRLTLAATLIIMGVVFLIDNLTTLHVAWYVGRAWPLILVMLGLEWLWHTSRGASAGDLRLDAGSVAVMVIIALVAANLGAAYRAPFRLAGPGAPSIQIAIPASPAISVPPVTVGFRGNVEADMTLRYDAPVPDLAEVQVDDSSAEIAVVKGERFQVELTVAAFGSSEHQAQSLADQVRLNVVPGRLTHITSVRPGGGDLRLSYRVQVPAGVSLRVGSASGSVSVHGVDGSLNIQTVSGSIDVADTGALVVATSSSGSIQITGARGAVRANAASGSIRAENPGGSVSAQTSSGSITVQTDRVGGDYDLGAMSGTVRVILPADAGVKVSARASSGNVSGPRWLTIGEGRNSGSGTQGTGERQVSVHTSSGNIQINTH